MTPERWQRIEDLFESARVRVAAAERAAFLDGACGTDTELRAEVEALLRADDSAGSFINTSAVKVAAGVIADEQIAAMVGATVGHYRVLSLLGAGGMGEVYLAEDIRNGRKAALKLLPDYFSKDAERIRRFDQEARAVLALNHPNIVTVYEIGNEAGMQFIASEFVNGVTLRERMAQSPLNLVGALDIAIQVAAALSAAHGEGIAHRDVKPENIMLRTDGYVKVLDFGLAKLIEERAETSETESLLKFSTRPGMVLGTAHYMSPEQARGIAIDERTDVWSLGVVVYEMVTGHVPFDGPTPTDVVASVIGNEPPAIRLYRDVPEALEVIVSTALTKDRDERYHAAREMLGALRRLKQRLDIATELERSSGSQATDVTISAEGAGKTETTVRQPPTRSTSSAEYIATEIKKHKLTAISLLALFLCTVGAGIVVVYRLRSAHVSASSNMKATRLTANGKVSAIDLSPDAKYITYTTVESDGRESLWIKQVLSGGTLQLISPTFFEILGTTFSPDGTLIYYAARSKDSPTGALYKIPTIGGSSKRVLTDIAGAVGIARDATRLAFVRAKKDRTELFTANTDGTDVRELAERAGSEWFAREGPAWSPDSRTIACGGGSHAHGNVSTVYAVDAATGNVRELTPHTWAVVYRVAWVADGSALVLIGKEEGGGLSQVWKISLPSGEVTRVTSDLSGHGSISLGVSADATALVTEKNDTLSKLWVVPADGNTTNARQVISGADREDGHYGLAWTPDGRIVYTSTAGGFQDIWVTDADGGHQQQLTSDSYVDYAPAVSPDGRYIVFKTERKGDLLYLSHLWRMDIDGSNLRQLTNGNDHIPRWSPDSRWVVYASLADDGYDRLWRVPVDGGAQERLSPLKAQWPDISPDGSSIACALFDEQLDAPRWRIAILPASGDSPSKIFDYRSPGIRRVHWSPDGRALVYTETNAGVSNLWRQAVNGGAPTRLTDFNSDLIFHFDFSPDGQWLACSRGVNNSDAILLSNFP